jgi:MHS family proline/betaine transporter-like MFS transporter
MQSAVEINMLRPEALGAHRRKAIVATVIGNGLEWFDWTVYSFFAVTISRQFFPTGNDLNSLLLAVATFGVGFFMRPVGGIVLGICSDRIGRKFALSLTIVLMALGTGIIGLTPNYAQIGMAAPILVVVARLLQGFSAGGEMGGATAFLTEYSPPEHRAYYSSWIQSSIGFAVLLGTGIGVLTTSMLDTESLNSWGWRIPFLLGILIGPVGYYIRQRIDESPVFSALVESEKTNSPLKEVVQNYPRETFVSFSMVILWTVSSYVFLYYMPTYTVRALHQPQSFGLISGMVGGAVMLCASPIIGRLADIYGRRPFLIGATLAFLFLAYPMFAWINRSPGLPSLLVFQAVFGFLIAAYTAPILAAFAELFPAKVLSTGLSVAYNFAVMLFGGFAPFFITWLIAKTGSNMAPAFYVIFASLVSLTGMTYMKGAREKAMTRNRKI